MAGLGAMKLQEQQRRRASRVEADVLGIFGKSAAAPPGDDSGDGDGNGGAPRLTKAALNWRKARLASQQEVLTKRWHKDVNRGYKRMWLAFKDSHTLLSGLVYRGAAGYTRAQTVQVLLNSLALEIVILCMFYSAPSDGPLVINPVKIVVNGAFCAFICIPVMLIFAWLFQPMIFVRFGGWSCGGFSAGRLTSISALSSGMRTAEHPKDHADEHTGR